MFKYFIALFSVVACVKASRSDLLDLNYLEESTKVPCILGMIKKHITNVYQHGSLVTVNIPKKLDLLSQLLLTELNEMKDSKVTILINNPLGETQGEMIVPSKVKCYILLIESMGEFQKMIEMIKSQASWNPIAPFMVIFLGAQSDFTLTVQTKTVMQEFFDESVMDVYVISTRIDSHIVQCQTWYPYEGKRCGENVLKVRTVSECEFFGLDEEDPTNEEQEKETYDESENEEESEELFLLQYDFSNLGPKVPSDLNGCPITVRASVLEPFVVRGNNSLQAGFEVMMTKVISEQMNMQPIFTYSDPNLALKPLTSNNVTGFYADLVNHKVDIMIGGMFDNHINKEMLSSSITYVEDDFTWCVPKAKIAPIWISIFSIFHPQLWFLPYVSIFIMGLVLFGLVRYEKSLKDNFWWTLVTALTVSINSTGPPFITKIKASYTRFFMVALLLYGMNFSAAYQSNLVSIMTKPKLESQIDTVKEAIEQGFTFEGGENILGYIKGDDEVR